MYSSVSGLIGAALPIGPWSFAINSELAYSVLGPCRGHCPSAAGEQVSGAGTTPGEQIHCQPECDGSLGCAPVSFFCQIITNAS